MASRDFFIYTAEFLPLNANATATVRIPIQSDSMFQLTEITGAVKAADSDEVVIAAPAITLTLLDEGSGRLLFDRAVEWSNVIGTAQRPFVLPQFKLLPANATLNVTVSSLIGSARRVRISFVGYKIFASPNEIAAIIAAGGA